jgi:hypothetical protein
VKAAVVTMLVSGAMVASGGIAMAAAPAQTGVTVVESGQGKGKGDKGYGYKRHGYKSYGYNSYYGYRNYGRGYGGYKSYGYNYFDFGLSISFSCCGGYGHHGYGHH